MAEESGVGSSNTKFKMIALLPSKGMFSMKKIDQTTFGGKDAPVAEQGNCFQACVATVLQMPLEEAYSCIGIQAHADWLGDFNKWLEQYGLGCFYIFHTKENPVKTTEIKGFCIAECMSETLYNGERHTVVMKDHFELFHDPNPHAKEQGELQGVYIFVPLEPYRLVRKASGKETNI